MATSYNPKDNEQFLSNASSHRWFYLQIDIDVRKRAEALLRAIRQAIGRSADALGSKVMQKMKADSLADLVKTAERLRETPAPHYGV